MKVISFKIIELKVSHFDLCIVLNCVTYSTICGDNDDELSCQVGWKCRSVEVSVNKLIYSTTLHNPTQSSRLNRKTFKIIKVSNQS